MGIPKPCSQLLGSLLYLDGKCFQLKGINLQPFTSLESFTVVAGAGAALRPFSAPGHAVFEQGCSCVMGVLLIAMCFAHRASRHSLVSADGSEEQGRRPKVRSQRSVVVCKHPAVADDPSETAAACSALVLPGFPVAGGH